MWEAFANANTTYIFSAKILACMPYLMIKVLNMLTNDIVRFEQLGPGYHGSRCALFLKSPRDEW